MIKQVQRAPDLRTQIYDSLRDAIRSGVYAPGVRLLEQDVARDMGVSRTPAREAMALLTRDGILVQERRGFSLPVYDAKQINDVFEIRRALEPLAVRLACERATAAELEALRVIAAAELSEAASARRYAAVNLKIRRALFVLCGNPRLEATIHLNDDLIHYVRLKTLNVVANREVSVARWRDLIEATHGRDALNAARIMTDLLDLAQKLVLDLVTQSNPVPLEG